MNKFQFFFEADEKKEAGIDSQIHIPEEPFVHRGSFIVQEKYFRDLIELSSCFKF